MLIIPDRFPQKASETIFVIPRRADQLAKVRLGNDATYFMLMSASVRANYIYQSSNAGDDALVESHDFINFSTVNHVQYCA